MDKSPKSNGNNDISDNSTNKFHAKSFYSKMEKGGLNYIKKEENYLVISIVFPIFTIITQVLNLIFMLLLEAMKPPTGPKPEGPLPIDKFTSIFIFLIIALIALINSMYLIQWKQKIHSYEDFVEKFTDISSFQETNDFPKNNVSLTRIFYDIIKSMERLRIVFLGLNLICVYYFVWFFGFLIIRREALIPPFPHPIFSEIVAVLTIISLFVLIIYIAFEWRHFYGWNKKLTKLRQFEKKVYKEINL